MDRFHNLGAQVHYLDPYVPVVGATREHAFWQGHSSVAWNQETISSFDLIVVSTWHSSFNAQELADWASLIVDTRNAMAKIKTRPGQLVKA
jgi:UDP-N-acetyl-D-glucosamine dehydrogenase